MSGGFLETIGLEFEGMGATRDQMIRLLSSQYGDSIFNSVQVARDASVEARLRLLSGNGTFGAFDHNPLARSVSNGTNRITMGYEITTAPLTFEEQESLIPRVMKTIIANGESISPRASLHIHIGFAHNFKLLTNALRVGLWLEPLFYRLAGMGGMFRGEINNAIYCRPLGLGVAVPAEGTRAFYKLPNIKRLLSARDSDEFWLCYGINRDVFASNPNRYVPARYFGLNLLSVLIHGTLEYRYFNQTLNPAWILTMARYCQAITELISTAPRDWANSLPIPDMRTKFSEVYYLNLLGQLESAFTRFDVSYLPTDVHKRIIRKILDCSEIPDFNDKIPMTHIRNWVLSSSQIGTGIFDVEKNICESGFVDIHNIDRMNLSTI